MVSTSTFDTAVFVLACTSSMICVRILTAGVSRSGIANKLPRPLLSYTLSPKGFSVSKLRKLHESCYYWAWHSISTCMVLCVSAHEAWFTIMIRSGDGRWALVDWPHTMSRGVRWLYLVELSFWLSCIAFIAFETRRNDSVQMALHHVATVGLIAISYFLGYYRIGLVVLAIHDVSDVTLYAGKYFNYMGYMKLSDLIFGLFVIVFFATRFIFFPNVLRAAWGPVTGYLPEVDYRQFPGSIILPSLLSVLQALHVFWLVLVFKVLHKKLIKPSEPAKDIRSDEEEVSTQIGVHNKS
jgi:hypothetical protein